MALSSSDNIRNLITTSAVTSASGGTDHCRIWPISRYSQQTVTTAKKNNATTHPTIRLRRATLIKLLSLLAPYAEQGLSTQRSGVRPSVCPVD